MNYLTHQLLNSEELESVRKNLNQEDFSWEDGKKTAGKHAANVKKNLQLKIKSAKVLKPKYELNFIVFI